MERHTMTLDPKVFYTIVPIQIPAGSCIKPEFIRLPKPGKQCPYTGLTRGFLNNLVLPCAINGHQPPVKSVSLRMKGCKTGVRLIYYDSLMEYLYRRFEEQNKDTENESIG